MVLAGLREGAWRPALKLAPRIGRGDIAADLVDVMRLDGRSDDLMLRRSVGARFGDNLETFLGRNLTDAGFWVQARDRNLPLARSAGLGLVPGALVVHEPGSRPVTLPLVAADGDLGFLAALLAADPDALAADPDPLAGSVLAVLVRQGLLREHAAAAARLLNLSAADAEFYGFGDPDLGWTARRDSQLSGGGTVRERMADSAPTSSMASFRAAVDALADASVPSLERHLLGALDATSHRLDAWVTSLAMARLAELREVTPAGVLVGGYGWVEGLRPDEPTPVTEVVPDEAGPLVRAIEDPGFIHAPSVHQAQVAAMLRNAHLAHGGGETDPFAVSLTSERIRLARWIFDGVRAGRSVGAVLGYLVERDLHERGLDFAVANAREVTPLPGQDDLPVAARRLDGLKLHELWANSEGHAVDHLVDGSQDEALRNKAAGVLRRLNASVDAAADALQAEQVHQFARGDLSRAVSTVADIDRGLAPPPDFDFLQTPRTGAAVTHRVVVLLDPDAPTTAGWTGPAGSAHAAAEPGLDAWLGRMLGPATGRTLTLTEAGAMVALPDLRIAASDFVRMATTEGGLRELAARVAIVAGAAVETAELVLDPALLELLELGRSLAALVTAAKPLDGSGLQPPHADPVPGVDVPELSARVSAARQLVAQAVSALDRVVAAPDDADAVRVAVQSTWGLGVGEAGVPTAGAGWAAAAARARADLSARQAEPAAATGTADQLAGELRALLGPGFVALPRFVAANAAELVASRDDPALVGDDPLAAEVWLTRMERVREPLARAGIALREAEALGGPAMALSVAQVPHSPGATWNALPASSYVDGASSLLVVGGDLLDPGRTLAGLLLDEWAEVVPSATETTGVAFRYDPPEAMAPHAILLAVPPVPGQAWTVGSLNQVLVETLELAKLRAVPPAALGAARQYLPAAVLAFNAEGDAPSTNPNVLTPPPGG